MRAGTPGGERDQVGVRLDPDHRRGRRREPRQVEAGAAAEVEDGPTLPGSDGGHRRLDPAVRVGRPVLDLVGGGVVPDVGAGDRARQVAAQGHAIDADEALRGLHLRGDDARGAVRGDPLDLDVLQRRLDRLAEPLADPLRVAGDLEALQREGAVGAGRRVQLLGGVPLHEERQLGVGDQAVDADLLPEQLGAVGAVPVALGRGPAEPLLDDGDVVDRDHPAEPATAEGGAGAHGLAERRLVGRGVVEHLDDLEVGAVGQRHDHVAGAEAGVHPAVGERAAEQ